MIATSPLSATLLDPHHSVLVVIDLQEKFKPTLYGVESLIKQTQHLLDAARLLNIPIVITEHYPKGLGPTLEELMERVNGYEHLHVFEKTHFGCYDEPGFMELMTHLSPKEGVVHKRQVVVCGIETHVCVNQTVTRLLQHHWPVWIVEDAVSSRNPANTVIGLKKMTQLGALSACVEMVLFEWLGHAKHPQFKAIQSLIL